MKKYIDQLRIVVFATIFCLVSSCKKDVAKENISIEPDTVFICVKNSTEFTFDDIEIDMDPYGKQHYGVVRYGTKTKYLPFKFAHDKSGITFTIGTGTIGYFYGKTNDYQLLQPGKYTCELLFNINDNNQNQYRGIITRDIIQ